MGSVADYRANVSLNRKDGTSELLLDVSSDIYYYETNYDDEEYDEDEDDDEEFEHSSDDSEGSNETQATFKITQKFIDSLKPGDKLVLNGDGSCW